MCCWLLDFFFLDRLLSAYGETRKKIYFPVLHISINFWRKKFANSIEIRQEKNILSRDWCCSGERTKLRVKICDLSSSHLNSELTSWLVGEFFERWEKMFLCSVWLHDRWCYRDAPSIHARHYRIPVKVWLNRIATWHEWWNTKNSSPHSCGEFRRLTP